jgi:hypothetical protein
MEESGLHHAIIPEQLAVIPMFGTELKMVSYDVFPVTYELLTQCIGVFRVVVTLNSDCFPKQH